MSSSVDISRWFDVQLLYPTTRSWRDAKLRFEFDAKANTSSVLLSVAGSAAPLSTKPSSSGTAPHQPARREGRKASRSRHSSAPPSPLRRANAKAATTTPAPQAENTASGSPTPATSVSSTPQKKPIASAKVSRTSSPKAAQHSSRTRRWTAKVTVQQCVPRAAVVPLSGELRVGMQLDMMRSDALTYASHNTPRQSQSLSNSRQLSPVTPSLTTATGESPLRGHYSMEESGLRPGPSHLAVPKTRELKGSGGRQERRAGSVASSSVSRSMSSSSSSSSLSCTRTAATVTPRARSPTATQQEVAAAAAVAATSKPVSNEQRFEETLRRFSSPIERVSETYEVMIKGTVVEYGESDVVEPKVSGPPSSSPQATSRPSTQPPTRESSRLDRRGQQPDDKHHGVHGGSHSRSSSRTSRHSSLSSSSSNSSSSRAVSEDGKGSGQRGKRSSRSGAHGKQHHGRFTYKKLRKSVLGWFSLGDSQKREADTHDSDDDSTPQRSVPSLRESTSEVAPFALSGEVDVFFRCTRESEFMALTEEWAKHTAVSDALDESTENEHSLELAEFSASVTPPPTDRWLNYLHYDVDPHNGLRFAVFPPYLWHEFLSIAPSVLYHVARGMLVVESVVPSQSTGDALLSPICTSKHAEVPQLTVTNAEGISAPARYPSLSPPCAASASSMGSVRGGESPGLVRKQGALTGAGSSFGSPSPAAASWDTVNLVATSSAPRRDSAAEDLSAVTSPQHTRFRDCFLCLAESHLLFFNSFAELKLHFRLDSVETMLYSSSEDGFPSDPFCCFKTKAGEDELEEPALWLTFTFMPWAPRSEDPSSDVEETPAVGHSLSGDKDGSMEAQGSPQHRQSLIQRQESFLHAFQTVMPRQMKQVPLHELLRGSTPKSPHPPSHPPHTSHGAASAPLAVTEHTHSHTTVPHVHHHLLHKRPICPPMLHASALTGKGPYDKEKPTLLVEVKRTDLQEVVTDEPSSGHHHHRHRPLRHRFLCTRLSPSTGVAADSHQPASVPCTGDMSNAWRRMVLPVAGWDFNDPPEDVSASTNVALSLRMAMSRPAILAQKSDLFMSPIRTPKSMQSFAFVSGDRAVTSPDGNSGAAAETDVKPSAPRPPPAAKSGALKGPKVIVPRSKAAVDTQTDPVAADTASAGDEMVQNGSMVFAARKPQKKKSKLVRRRQV